MRTCCMQIFDYLPDLGQYPGPEGISRIPIEKTYQTLQGQVQSVCLPVSLHVVEVNQFGVIL